MGFSRFMEKKRVDTPLPWNHLEHEELFNISSLLLYTLPFKMSRTNNGGHNFHCETMYLSVLQYVFKNWVSKYFATQKMKPIKNEDEFTRF